MQEFFAALWLFKQPGKIREVLQQCLTKEKKHMKYLIPFMCRLSNKKNPSLMECLIPAEELKNLSEWFLKEMITTFHQSLREPDESDAEGSGSDVDILFLCQCLYESQCPEACVYLLDKLDYCLDLTGHSLDPDSCCAVAYVVSQSKERKIQLDLEDAMISEPGLRRLFGCRQVVQWCDLQLWKMILLSEGQMDHVTLLGLAGNQLHLPVEGKMQLFQRAANVLQKAKTKVDVCFYWEKPDPVCQRLCLFLSQTLSYISTVSFVPQSSGPSGETTVYGNLFCAAAEREHQTGEKILEMLTSVCGYGTYPLINRSMKSYNTEYQCDFLLDLFSHVKDYETKTGVRVLPALQSVLLSAPSVWTINLSEKKTSILLEVLKLQPEKKPVQLTGWSDEESEVRSFLQCLPYISQLRFQVSDGVKLFGSLFCAAAEREHQTGEKILEMLTSECGYGTYPLISRFMKSYNTERQCDFLLDLFSHVKDYETKTVSSPVSSFSLDHKPLREKTSILLEVLKLQPEKKPVQLTGWSDEESEVRSFLQCLPYISQLRSMKIYNTEYQCDFLLDLFSHVKDYETKTGVRVLPALQSVLLSAPSVWIINLSERKTSILLDVLKLQPEKRPVKLTGWSGEESEVRSFLQCLPYISQLSVSDRFQVSDGVKLFVMLFCAAAEREHQTGEKILEMLTSVCRYSGFPLRYRGLSEDDRQYCSDFLLDLFSHVKDYETKTGVRVLPALQSVLLSAPSVWTINLSEKKTSILLDVLKLQPEKKPVQLTGWSGEESEVRSLVQCLPYISQLRFQVSDGVKLFVMLFCAAAEREHQTGEKILEVLTSVCGYRGFPLSSHYMDDYTRKYHSDFLLDLFSHVKDYETRTGVRVLPALQSVLLSAPSVWIINLSERKTSILLEVLKLQPEKRPVKLTGWSYEESEVRSFLQCLPYISQLSVSDSFEVSDGVKLFVMLFCAAAVREHQTGEKILEMLTSVCEYGTFPLINRSMGNSLRKYQCGFLLDLFSHVKDYETKTGVRVLPALQSVLLSAPSVWTINLSERKTSILLDVLKLQPEKKPVQLTGWSDEESEVRSFLQCLPYISQLRFQVSDGVKLFVMLFCAAAVREHQTGGKILEMLTSVCGYGTFPLINRDMGNSVRKYQCDFLLDLFSHVKDYETKTGVRVLPALQSVLLSAPSVWTINLSEKKTSILLEVLKLQPEKRPVQLTGWSGEESEVRSFLQCLPYISQLSCDPQFFQSVCSSISVQSRQEVKQLASLLQLLGFTLHLTGELQRKTCRTVGTVLRLCSSKVDLTLTPSKVSIRGLSLLFRSTTQLHSLRLSAENSQQLPAFLHEIQDQDLTLSTLTKIGGDLSSCCLDRDLLHHVLQRSSTQTFTVDLRKYDFLQENFTHLLPFLDRIIFKRSTPGFVLTAIREIFKTHSRQSLHSLLRSLNHVISLTCTELDSVDCAALLFLLKHSDRVKLNLLWTSIPAEQIEAVLLTLDKVSHLSVDRNLLLRFIHCCAACDVQQEAASGLLGATQHRLDLSCSLSVELSEQEKPETLCLTAEDCRAVSSILRLSSQDTQLDLRDCEVDDSGLDLLFPVLNKVRLRASKAVILRLVSLVPGRCERDTVRRAVSLSRALGGELDLSHTALDLWVCVALAMMLDLSEGLKELDLSHCQLTDQLLLTLTKQLHKVQVLDLSHNNITDASTGQLLQLVSINPSMDSVRLFSNNIMNRAVFQRHRQFEVVFSKAAERVELRETQQQMGEASMVLRGGGAQRVLQQGSLRLLLHALYKPMLFKLLVCLDLSVQCEREMLWYWEAPGELDGRSEHSDGGW
ncbi:hypothetical protein INR49_002566 [Caranx melampygus]|nr:hypothetical protein INR49_002566 [Caranx melampygus]